MKWLPIAACLLVVCGCDSSADPGSSRHSSTDPGYSIKAKTDRSTDDRPRDYWSKPFKRIVIFGESTVEGGPWLRFDDESFADIVARLISECQLTEVEYYNKGIGANCISPRSPAYENSRKPSAMERYQKDVIALNPDLFILSYGLNDMNAAMPIDDFVEDMQTIISDVKSECQPLIVLTTVYHMTAFGSPTTNRGSIESTKQYNEAIRQLAKKNECLLADIWEAEGTADWMIHPDGTHANKLGNIVIAHRIFNTIARNCSGVSAGIFKRDLPTDKGMEAIQLREKDGDPFDPWWMPK